MFTEQEMHEIIALTIASSMKNCKDVAEFGTLCAEYLTQEINDRLKEKIDQNKPIEKEV